VSSFKNVFVDSTGSANLLYSFEDGDLQMVSLERRMIAIANLQLQSHASETLAMLEDSSVDRFAEVFLKDQSLGPQAFDEFIQ